MEKLLLEVAAYVENTAKAKNTLPLLLPRIIPCFPSNKFVYFVTTDFGMFTYIDETRCMWINGSSLESEMEFELVGVVLGLAIYNGVILDVHFTYVIYKKLQGYTPNLQDLSGLQPSLARSLRELLEFEGDVEDVFCYSFQVI